MAYVTTYPSLAEFEAASTKRTTDADYQKLVAANAANVIPGAVHDEIWRSLDLRDLPRRGPLARRGDSRDEARLSRLSEPGECARITLRAADTGGAPD